MSQLDKLTQFYASVQTLGKLRTPMHAERYTRAVLQQFGLNLSRGVKKDLASALPDRLAGDLTSTFWLMNFRNTNMPAIEFQERVARRSGNSDKAFARFPILAVFNGLQTFISQETQRQVADDLAPDLRTMWEEASRMVVAN